MRSFILSGYPPPVTKAAAPVAVKINAAAPTKVVVIDLVSSSDDEDPIFPAASAALQSINSRGEQPADNDSEVQILSPPTSRKRPSTVLSASSATKNPSNAIHTAKRARINLPNQPLKFEPVGFGGADNDEITEVSHSSSMENAIVSPSPLAANGIIKSRSSVDDDDEVMVIDSGKHSVGAMDMPHQRGKTVIIIIIIIIIPSSL